MVFELMKLYMILLYLIRTQNVISEFAKELLRTKCEKSFVTPTIHTVAYFREVHNTVAYLSEVHNTVAYFSEV